MKYYIATLFLLSGLLFPVSSVAQALYENYDNIVTINVPGIDPSELAVTAEGGTLVHKKGTQWIARPSGDKDTSGVTKDFVIKVFTNKNGKKELLSTKAYEVREIGYIIDYYDETTHNVDKTKLYDDILLKVDGIERICLSMYIDGFDNYHPVNDPVCGFRFSDRREKLLRGAVSSTKFYLTITEAWNESGQKIKLSPIKLTFYRDPTNRTISSKVWNQTLIDGIYYEFSETTAKVAEVIDGAPYYAGKVVIPSRVVHNEKGYNVTSIGRNAFYNCPITSISIPESVKYIDDRAFNNCTGLTSIVLPGGLTYIGFKAFSYCTALTSITIPESVTTINATAFSHCTALTSITLPSGLTSIANYTFYNCSKLPSITIPENVKSIGAHAFSDCTGLTSITFPKSVETIGASAFQNCTGLTSITLPDNSKADITWGAFLDCTGLTSITIPSNIKSIGLTVFKGCLNLLNIICLGNTPVFLYESDSIFDDIVYTNATLSYPADSDKLYEEAPVWRKFRNRNLRVTIDSILDY